MLFGRREEGLIQEIVLLPPLQPLNGEGVNSESPSPGKMGEVKVTGGKWNT